MPKPADPEWSGHGFINWFDAASGGTAYTWPHTLSADVTMNAQWPAQHTITFESQGGSEVAAITGHAGTEANKPADPTRSGYAFAGWFDAASGGTAYSWPHTLNASVTMHAQWQAIVYNIVYTLNDGINAAGNPATYTIEDSAITLNAPSRDGYSLEGW